ncbi:hypothetical protein HQ325_21330 [Rhodococcus sp. BP-349]|uniref:hypothetical protein n=1 Tax=unclassified Rhodococcus (in: high G+C Gram-positive bacteria) TaxID=192944 RepID=UPI001C9A9AC8|nr:MULTISPECIES: hypothetical protein [unclassified Rhodococcus (in: high G+C Gram-positive bacteria)]MBY6541216.1 hypothetical protein [Rhodococcus sp. BP-363]MBY6544758.1 hypothetical protein [Rhodococcus sp. BP-369]MBY6563988.1 hypothetical protein [Rhodococcus sp. BP-370]MBY6579075.1 hypothetical protein [Rhodococcus sp. BP-364]MBY6588376.1 hypothetical protein [Rhodococcus sp. BP-358]
MAAALALLALMLSAGAALLPARPVPTIPPTAAPGRRVRWLPPLRWWWVPPLLSAGMLALAGLAAAIVDAPVTGPPLVAALVLVVAVAVTGGTVVVPAVFHLARRRPEPGDGDADDERPVLRGGLVIGTLERIAVVVAVLTGWPEGIAVVLAVKGLARYPELRDPRASEYFIIGTFTSVLWALAAGGVGVGLAA